MDTTGYVATGTAGWTELRVHGVAGTDPATMLRHTRLRRVAGDDQAGFYRRVWPSREQSLDTDDDRVEAYSWGGLTSGGWTRALWLLLLPFMLVNVAWFMTPGRPHDEQGTAKLARQVLEAVQRLLALSLTVTFALSTVTTATDLLGWQCARRGTDCAATAWLAFYGWGGMDHAGRRLAVLTLLPLASIVLLWWLARRTWQQTESVTAEQQPHAAPATWVTPLENRGVWDGKGPVARLRAVHVAVALCVVTAFLLAPLAPEVPWGHGTTGGRVVGGIVAAACLLAGLCVLAVLPASVGRRLDTRDPAPDREHNPQRWLSRAAVVLVVLALAAAWWRDRLGPGGPAVDRPEASVLPGLAATTRVTFLLQLALLLLVGLLTLVMVWLSHTAQDVPPAWKGLAGLVFAGLGWALGCGLAAAVTLRVADVLGTPVPAGDDDRPRTAKAVLLPVDYFWSSIAVPFLLVVLALFAGYAYRSVGKAVTALVPVVDAAYEAAGVATTPARTADVARAWSWAALTDRARGLLVRLVVVATLVLLSVGLVRWRHPEPPYQGRLAVLVPAGGLAMAGLVLGLLWVGRRAYTDESFRRTVGILWDLGTFWPRAAHPLAPPCYAERTVPDLLRRVAALRAGGGKVVLSCHSQGSVIGAAAVAAMTDDESGGVVLLTYGSPLRRLYAAFFPAWFGTAQLDRVGALLAQGTTGRLPWVNLHRRSDPIGGPVFADAGTDAAPALPAAPPAGVDWFVLDPQYTPAPGDWIDPGPLGHSDYDEDPLFCRAQTVLRACRP